jgi:nucleotide-binding universal stress UspA family protein
VQVKPRELRPEDRAQRAEAQSVIQKSNLALDYEPEVGVSVSAQVLRRWCDPSLTLAITDLADEEKLLFHVIRQAMPGRAKVLLVHVLPSGAGGQRSRGKNPGEETGSSAKSVRLELERMAHQLRWVGVHCEPVRLRGVPEGEIPELIRSRGVDRVILSVQVEKDGHSSQLELAKEILPGIGIPLCVLGGGMPSRPRSEAPAGRITLALSLHSECEAPLSFASRLAQEQRAKLTLMHVFDPADKNAVKMARTSAAVASRLPAQVLREAELLCAVEIVVRQGDAAGEILSHVNSTRQDFLVLGPVAPPRPGLPGGALADRVVSAAHCPVVLLGDAMASPGSRPMLMEQRKLPRSVHP